MLYLAPCVSASITVIHASKCQFYGFTFKSADIYGHKHIRHIVYCNGSDTKTHGS